MRSYAALALLAGAAVANPVPQEIDWSAVDVLEPVAEASVPVVDAEAAQTTVTYAATQAASSVSAAVMADPTKASPKKVRRSDNSGCDEAIQPAAGDTVEAFKSNDAFSQAAKNAVTPNGYYLAYKDQDGASEGVYGYMGFSVLDEYNVATCADRCNGVEGCSSFNICKIHQRKSSGHC